MNTTSYNHSALGTAAKPLLPNAEFAAIFDQVNAGNPDISAWTKKYSFESSQNHLIQGKIAELSKARMRAIGFFDSLVQKKVAQGNMQPTAKYAACQWLTTQLGLENQIDDLDGLTLEQYQKTVSLCNKYL